VAAKEYLCTLIHNRPGKWHTPAGQDTIGQEYSFRFDLDTLQSRMNALVLAIEKFGGKHPASIEQYGLEVCDAEGVLLTTLQATDDDLRQFREGYRANVAEGVAPVSLANYGNDQLIAELRRRLG
jgi:hypothetical protein